MAFPFRKPWLPAGSAGYSTTSVLATPTGAKAIWYLMWDRIPFLIYDLRFTILYLLMFPWRGIQYVETTHCASLHIGFGLKTPYCRPETGYVCWRALSASWLAQISVIIFTTLSRICYFGNLKQDEMAGIKVSVFMMSPECCGDV